MTSPYSTRSNTPTTYPTPYRSSWRRVAVSSIFWLGLTALSVLMLAALGVMGTVVS